MTRRRPAPPSRDHHGAVLRALRTAVAVAVLLAVLVGLLWAFQRRLVYLPDGGPVPAAASGAAAPTTRFAASASLNGDVATTTSGRSARR